MFVFRGLELIRVLNVFFYIGYCKGLLLNIEMVSFGSCLEINNCLLIVFCFKLVLVNLFIYFFNDNVILFKLLLNELICFCEFIGW